VSSSQNPNYYIISGIMTDEDEARYLGEETNPAARHKFLYECNEKFLSEIWPVIKQSILTAIQDHDRDALIRVIETRRDKALVIKTDSQALLEELRKLQRVDVENIGSITEEELEEVISDLEAYEPKTLVDQAFRSLVYCVRFWEENHMDQWERFKYEGEHGPVYVTISLQDPNPDSFDLVDKDTGTVIKQAGK